MIRYDMNSEGGELGKEKEKRKEQKKKSHLRKVPEWENRLGEKFQGGCGDEMGMEGGRFGCTKASCLLIERDLKLYRKAQRLGTSR